MTTSTKEKVVVSTRLDREQVRLIEQLRHRANRHRKEQKLPDLENMSQMLEWLLNFAVEEVLEQTTVPNPKPPLTRTGYATRAEVLMEFLSDLIARVESHDTHGAVLLARAVAKSSTAYSEELAKRHKQ